MSISAFTPRIEDAPIKRLALDTGPHSVTSLLDVVIDIILEFGVPEIDPYDFVGVTQADGREYLYIGSDMLKD